ncbi:MAG: extracellular solute-binding protein [Oscillospiraceae bacterium]
MKKNRFLIVFLLVVLLTVSAACTAKNEGGYPKDILTQKVTPKGKTQITILVKYAFSINAFEEAAEKKFPNIDIIQLGNFTANSGLAEYEARMEHDDLGDIVMAWPVESGEQYCEERLIDLSAMPLTGKYNTARLDKISKNGKLFYLPGPSQIRGIVYNKTLFEENGWEVPSDFEGFIALCQAIEKEGMRSLQLGLGNSEVLDTAFAGYSYASCYSKPEDARWIADYNEGKGKFNDHFSTALDTFQVLIDSGVLKPEDLNVTYAQREQMLFNRQCAMVEDSVLVARMGKGVNGCTDEFAIMPFFNPVIEGDWARLYPVCYIGLNKHLEEAQNKEKYDLVMELMEYITTPEGQLALAADTGGMYSALNGMPPPNVPEIAPLTTALSNGRCAIFPQLKNAQGALREGLAGMVKGELTKQDVANMVDKQNLTKQVPMVPMVLGSAKENFTILDTGNFITDAMVKKSGCEIALLLDNGKDGLCSGKGICSTIYKGDITIIDIQRLTPDSKYGERNELQKVTMTGASLLDALEYSVPVGNGTGGWFYYFSGLRMEYAPAAEPGERIRKITDENGKEIDPEKVYTVAILDGSVDEKYLLSQEDTHIKISDLLMEEVQDAKVIAPDKSGRFRVCQP